MLSGYGFLSGTESGVTSWRRLSAATDRPGLEGTTRISPQRVLNGVHARLQRAMDARERCVPLHVHLALGDELGALGLALLRERPRPHNVTCRRRRSALTSSVT